MNINILPQSKQIPTLVASYFHLCGKINVDKDSKDPSAFSIAKRTVILQEKSKNERRTTTSDNGEYCFEVKPGQYTLIPVVTAHEKDQGLKFYPSEKVVMVDGTPVLNINFGQTKLPISGRVKCLDPSEEKCKSITVVLLQKDKQVGRISLGKDLTFKFEKVLPGRYSVRVE